MASKAPLLSSARRLRAVSQRLAAATRNVTIQSRSQGSGYILVAVLAVMVMLTGLLAAGSILVRSALGTARVEDADIASSGLLLSGIEIAAYQLAVLRIRPELVNGRRIRLTGGGVTPHVTDEAGKVDLNAADPKLLLGVLTGVDMDQATATAVVTRIVELRGPPNGSIPEISVQPTGQPPVSPPENGRPPAGVATASESVQSSDDSGNGKAPRKRRGLQSVEDVGDIEGVRREDMRLLRRRLTIYNPDGRLNILTADPDVLQSLPGMTKLKLEQLLAARESGSEDAARDAQAALGGDLASFIKALPGPAYTVRIDADETSGRKKSAEAVITASKSPNQPYYILDWRE